jgi:ribonuclease R
LVDHFEIKDQKSIDALSHRLSAMVRDGQIAKDGFKFQLLGDQPTFEATVYINSKGWVQHILMVKMIYYCLSVSYV